MTNYRVHNFLTEAGNSSSYDIFAYFRDNFKGQNLTEKGIISIEASSTEPPGYSSRAYVSTLINDDDSMRWVSAKEKNASITINFHANTILLTSYKIETSIGERFINSWDVFGVRSGKRILIHRVVNNPLCSNTERCEAYVSKTFFCDRFHSFSKFIFVSTNSDSMKEDRFSMSKLKFYGIINPSISFITGFHRCKTQSLMLFVYVLLAS